MRALDDKCRRRGQKIKHVQSRALPWCCMGYIAESRTARKERERRIRAAEKQATADRRAGKNQHRQRGRKYCCQGCEKGRPAVQVVSYSPLLCNFCDAGVTQRRIVARASP